MKSNFQQQHHLQKGRVAAKSRANCEWVPEKSGAEFLGGLPGPSGFLEMMLLLELDFMGLSPGRLDQYLYPYYKRDLEAGRITKNKPRK